MAIFDNDEKNISYALGMNMCEYISHLPIKIEIETQAVIKTSNNIIEAKRRHC